MYMMCGLRQGLRTVVLLAFVALGVVKTKQTVSIQMKVNQYPAIIYHGAQLGVPVLSIEAYGIIDQKPVDTIVLTSMAKTYFEIHQQPKQLKEWVITVKKTIDKPVGYVFQFSIYGYLDGDVRDRHIMINVTEENRYPPTFDQTQYNFIALHNGYTKGLVDIGSVHAKDFDSEVYNSVFHYHILDEAVLDYFIVDLTTGFIQQMKDIPHTTTKMEFQVTAFDGGSPQLLSSTNVVVTVTDLAPPEIFCVAVEESVARICWKDPTKGSYVMRYELIFQMNDQNATTIPVTVNGIKDETCSVVRGNQIGRNYTFTVRVVNATDISPESLSRKVSIQRKGLYGDCPVFSNCSVWEPCGSHGNCLVNDDLGYTCNCSEGWGGRNCTGVDVCTSSVCNEGTCHYAGDRQFTCECPDTHYGKRCEKLSTCFSQPCGQGHCIPRGERHICVCPDGTERINCDDGFCEPDDSFYDRTGRYFWPRTMSGDTAKIICHYGPRINFSLGVHQYASRECALTYNGNTYWKPPVTSECRELQEADVTENLKSLASMTRDASALQPEEIANITNVLEEYFYFSFENIEIAEKMTSVVGNLLDANESVLMESNFRNHSSERLLWLLEEYTDKVKTDSNITLETENINIQVVQNPDNEFIYKPKLQADNMTALAGVTLKFPREALVTENSSVPRIQLLTFRSSSFFIPQTDPPHQDTVLRQWVITAVVHGRKLSNLTEPVEITIQNIADRENHTCVFWNTDNKTWSTDGVVTDKRADNYTRCHSYHLTSFAILLDPSPTYALSGRHERILTYISYIGCGISMVGLLLTIITYSMFRCLNREKSGKILLNLCTSMLILNTVFIAGSEVSMTMSGEDVCKAVAILLHYFILTSLCWMLVEAINMYQALITVFTKYAGAFMLKRCVFAWGVPAIIVTITLAVNVDNYKTTTDFCFLSHGNHIAFYASLLAPACLILIINIIVFIMVARVILRPRFKGQVSSSDSINPAQIRGAFAVMTLLGITWVFGPFAINEAKVVVNYMFTILNSLQGFLIFVFRCCFNPEVRMAWILLVKTGKFKRRRGPLRSYSSDNTNSKTDSRSHGSVADTLKSNVYDSIGKPKKIVNQSKASKDLNAYFDNYHRYGNGDASGRRMSHPESSNGRFRNGEVVHGKGRGIATIYTGKHNGVRRLSGFVAERDEFTRL